MSIHARQVQRDGISFLSLPSLDYDTLSKLEIINTSVLLERSGGTLIPIVSRVVGIELDIVSSVCVLVSWSSSFQICWRYAWIVKNSPHNIIFLAGPEVTYHLVGISSIDRVWREYHKKDHIEFQDIPVKRLISQTIVFAFSGAFGNMAKKFLWSFIFPQKKACFLNEAFTCFQKL